MTKSLRFVAMLALAPLAGNTFGVWLGYVPASPSADCSSPMCCACCSPPS